MMGRPGNVVGDGGRERQLQTPKGRLARRVGPVALAALGAVTACSLAVDADRKQCSRNEDCRARSRGAGICVANVCTEPSPIVIAPPDAGGDAASVDKIWGCLGNVPAPPAEEPTVPVRKLLRFTGTITGNPLAQLPVKACQLADTTCEHPYEGTPKKTDDTGLLEVDLYSGFRGYFDMQRSPEFPDLMSALYYVLPIPNKDAPPDTVARVSSLGLLTKSEFDFASGSVGKIAKPEYGHVIFGIVDCSGHLVADTIARAEPVSPDSYTFYTDSAGTPSITQAKTSTNGNGGYVNVPPGVITLTVTRESGQFIGKREVVVRASTISYLIFTPTQ